MTDDQLFNALTRIVSGPELQRLQETTVLQNENGDYELFGQYTVSKEGNGYAITRLNDDTPLIFGSLQNAVTWATLDKQVKEIHFKRYKNSKDGDTKLLYLTKLQEDRIKKKQVAHELQSYVNTIRAWQMKKFRKETTK